MKPVYTEKKFKKWDRSYYKEGRALRRKDKVNIKEEEKEIK